MQNIKIYNNIWWVTANKYYWFFLIIKLSSYFKYTNIIDIIAYQNNYNKNLFICYTIYNYTYNLSIKLFITDYTCHKIFKNHKISIENLYYNCLWFERELAEMFNIIFKYKKDTRNLLLPYLDSTYPLKKNYPTIGYYNILYNITLEALYHTNLFTQL